MFIPDPDFYPFRIPGPGSQIPESRVHQQQQKKRRKKFVVPPFLSLKFFKIENYFILEQVKKKYWDPGSGKKTYSGSRI
jgi:hypothetical protein